MPITALYASVLAILFLVLSSRTIGLRRAQKVEIGDGGNRDLLRRVRVHANFAEYVPIALVLLACAESLRLAPMMLHAIGIVLCAGRLSHAYGLSQTPHIMPLRVFGMLATFAAIIAGIAACLALSIPLVR